MARTSPRRAAHALGLLIVWIIRSCRSWTARIDLPRRRSSLLPVRRQLEPLLPRTTRPRPPLRPTRIPSADATLLSPSRGPRWLSELGSVSSANDGSWATPFGSGSGSSSSSNNQHNDGDLALCIVPPDEAWDTLQRARHLARDDSFTIWPPAIRLFHPVSRDQLDPLEVAKVVERHGIKPFEVRLNQWAVIPHVEALSAQLEAVRSSSSAESDGSSSSSGPLSGRGMGGEEEIRRAQNDALIKREERLGRINKERRDRQREKRRAAAAAAVEAEGSSLENNARRALGGDSSSQSPSLASNGPLDDLEKAPIALSPRELLQEQRKMYDEFNGPCVVCLEPDADGRARLVELRDLLLRELFGNRTDFVDRYSPTATVAGPSSHTVYRGSQLRNSARAAAAATPPAKADAYRPLVPIGAFGTVSEAIRMARKLRQLWNPLSFVVTDLHVVSASGGGEGDGWSASAMSAAPSGASSRSRSTSTSLSDRSFLAKPPQVGCDAMIMLMGQEVLVNEDEGLEMTRILCERGEPGGAVRPTKGDVMESSRRNPRSQDDTDGDDEDQYDDLLQFLDEDDVDEGTVVVIGRTHFFTGEMRHYVGMPATSTSEQQAAISTTGSSGDTGASRRKGAVHPSRLQDGEFGNVPLSDADDDMVTSV